MLRTVGHGAQGTKQQPGGTSESTELLNCIKLKVKLIELEKQWGVGGHSELSCLWPGRREFSCGLILRNELQLS